MRSVDSVVLSMTFGARADANDFVRGPVLQSPHRPGSPLSCVPGSGRSRAHRKPIMESFRLGSKLQRAETPTCCRPLIADPPRRTRSEPREPPRASATHHPHRPACHAGRSCSAFCPQPCERARRCCHRTMQPRTADGLRFPPNHRRAAYSHSASVGRRPPARRAIPARVIPRDTRSRHVVPE